MTLDNGGTPLINEKGKEYKLFIQNVKDIVNLNNGLPLFDSDEGHILFSEFEKLPYDSKMLIIYRGIGCMSRENEVGSTICPVFNKFGHRTHDHSVTNNTNESLTTVSDTNPNEPTPTNNAAEIELIKTRFWIFKAVFILTVGLLFFLLFFIGYFLIKVTIADDNVIDGFSKIFKIIFQ